ncbi:MAG: hypothetical protein WCW56_03635 [Candidatus Paceibacterota bacterium]
MDNQNYDQKIEEIHALERENNDMLRSIKRTMILGQVFGVIRWVIIIGGTVGVFYYFQPVFGQLISTYRDLLGTLGS